MSDEKLVTEKGCIVVKMVYCGKHCSSCPHGPYAYQVTKVGKKQTWKYLGKARDVLPTRHDNKGW